MGEGVNAGSPTVAISLVDLAIIASAALTLSITIGGPIPINPWKTLPIGWPAAAAVWILFVLIRRGLAPNAGFWQSMHERWIAWWSLDSTRIALRVVVI